MAAGMMMTSVVAVGVMVADAFAVGAMTEGAVGLAAAEHGDRRGAADVAATNIFAAVR